MQLITESEIFKLCISIVVSLITFFTVRTLSVISKIENKVDRMSEDFYNLKGQHDERRSDEPTCSKTKRKK